MARKKKMLPKDFEDLLKAGDVAALKAVFATCERDARGGVFKQTALAFSECPDDLSRWLVAEGADIGAGDSYGETPLHSRARHWRGGLDVLIELGADVNAGEGGRGTPLHNAAGSGHVDNARVLLAHGAHVDALDRSGHTPLEHALIRCSNAEIAQRAKLADLLLQAGAAKTDRAAEAITRIGTNFEFHRAGFNPDYLEETDAGLQRLYALFGVPPVPRRALHDGRAPIVATAARWEDRHQELWELLVPSSGAAETVQGEVIRLSGRIARELDGNGGVNWDAQYRRMTDTWLAHVGSGKPLPAADLAEATALAAAIRKRAGEPGRMCELAVAWVALNPRPVKLTPPDYDR
ncbi:ankyrin repeat domain-containing protein [Sphingomonas sanxanigenens]|uniref:Uncharacterized protein n=1 Tax=Sphingomonas sanxanigenens DSM 19645 = NX02 TaxID=1123269 RepID=W0A779_9SPHN|nr:ankyrin repeat domain-containing protein [Sphingomonas sanxanigenens]AHE52332.1 hypothetical protein NX02_02870 [Sphingomonas sanxanigenens DSM 19645 = NX02]